jgi:hypothetical protein
MYPSKYVYVYVYIYPNVFIYIYIQPVHGATLTTLLLSYNRVGDEGAKALAEVRTYVHINKCILIN